MQKKRHQLDCCRKNKKADVVFKNAKIINVFTKEIQEADLAICKNTIVGIGHYEGVKEIDLQGKYLAPGLIDAHVHIESSMVLPTEFAKTVLPFGTTSLIADPHEIANVYGLEGIRYMLKESKKAPIPIYYMLPSCVPATEKETNGAILDAQKLEELLEEESILGLGEVMNVPAVLFGEEKMLQKLSLFKDKIIDGHAPDVSGEDLMAYRLAGVETDHECSSAKEAIERLRLGMYLQIRKGSAADNLAPIVKGLLAEKMPLEHCVFCTDDKHLEHILKDGHINSNVRESIALGVDPIEALCMASYYPAKLYGLKRIGAIAPGYLANLIVFEDLQTIDPLYVMVNGKMVVKNKEILSKEERPYKRYQEDFGILHTLKAPLTVPKDFEISLKGKQARVIGLMDKQILTHKHIEEVPVQEGKFIPNSLYNKIAVIERYTGKKQIGLGILKHFGIKNGAIAQTIAHDSHNIVCVGDNDKDLSFATNFLIGKQGGIVIVQQEKVLASLSLPIGGLMSPLTAKQVTQELAYLLKLADQLGVHKEVDPFLTLAFMALPVIPSLKITDQGLFDVEKFKHVRIDPFF